MKMNYFKPLLMVFVISLFANNLFAQGAYVNINAGYGLSMSSQNLNNFYNSTDVLNSRTDEQVNLSLGSGVNIGGALGYMFNKNIGAELGLSYLLGGKSKAQDLYDGDTPLGIPTVGTTDYTLSSNMLRINPTLVIASGFEKINPYAKFGFVIGSGSIMSEYIDNDGTDIEIRKEKLNGGLAFGLNAGVGALYSLSEKMSFFGELNMVNLSYAPTNGELTEATDNGANELSGMTIRQRETVFVSSYNRDAPRPDSQPRQELKQKFPFGSFGVNIGLRFSL